MLVVTVISTKGGSGKTTLVQMLASAEINRGGRVHTVDADTDQQLLEWEFKSDATLWDGLKRAPWPSALTTSKAPPTIEDLYELLNNLDEDGVDLCLIDTRPGENPDTEHLALASDCILIPAVPTQSDFVGALKSVAWTERMIATIQPPTKPPVHRVVVMNADSKAMNYITAPDEDSRRKASEKVQSQDIEVYQIIAELPLLQTPIPHSNQFRRLPVTGPLTVVRDTYLSDPAKRMIATHAAAALAYCDALLADVKTIVKER
jgi:chromosome partitioning protein